MLRDHDGQCGPESSPSRCPKAARWRGRRQGVMMRLHARSSCVHSSLSILASSDRLGRWLVLFKHVGWFMSNTRTWGCDKHTHIHQAGHCAGLPVAKFATASEAPKSVPTHPVILLWCLGARGTRAAARGRGARAAADHPGRPRRTVQGGMLGPALPA